MISFAKTFGTPLFRLIHRFFGGAKKAVRLERRQKANSEQFPAPENLTNSMFFMSIFEFSATHSSADPRGWHGVCSYPCTDIAARCGTGEIQ